MALGPDPKFSLRTGQMSPAEAAAAEIDIGLREYMLRVYNYMASGLTLTGIIAYMSANTPAILSLLYTTSPEGFLQPTMLAWIAMLSPLGFVLALSFGINRMSPSMAQAVFWGFSAVMGLSLAHIFLSYPDTSIARVFFITSGTFAGMSLYGYTTKRSLAAMGAFMFMGLIGIVIAQQGSVQLRQFGMEMLTINLVGRLTFRELGVLMTAIMVAGRSGSAFAAQLGTMKLTEEIDAMRTIGVSPMEALVMPRTLAVVVMMPLLGFYSSIVAIIGGGFLCAVALDIPPITFIQRLREVVPITDLWVGLIKAPVFGVIIALAGCYQGMQVKANAEEVGLRTTAAVVQAIFLVIVIDAFFAVFFTWVGWN